MKDVKMTEQNMSLGKAIYEGRLRYAYDDGWEARSKWPATPKAWRQYYHGYEVAEVDLALASAEEVLKRFKVDKS